MSQDIGQEFAVKNNEALLSRRNDTLRVRSTCCSTIPRWYMIIVGIVLSEAPRFVSGNLQPAASNNPRIELRIELT